MRSFAPNQVGDVPVTGAMHRCEMAFLLGTQCDDGSWLVNKRAAAQQPLRHWLSPWGGHSSAPSTRPAGRRWRSCSPSSRRRPAAWRLAEGIVRELPAWMRHAEVPGGPALRVRIAEEVRAMAPLYAGESR
jgi:hypothetical protein